jgi:hypothetical protein
MMMVVQPNAKLATQIVLTALVQIFARRALVMMRSLKIQKTGVDVILVPH